MTAVGESSVSEEDESNKCGICDEQMLGPTRMGSCTHQFCFECARQALERDRRCPMCREFVNSVVTDQAMLILLPLVLRQHIPVNDGGGGVDDLHAGQILYRGPENSERPSVTVVNGPAEPEQRAPVVTRPTNILWVSVRMCLSLVESFLRELGDLLSETHSTTATYAFVLLIAFFSVVLASIFGIFHGLHPYSIAIQMAFHLFGLYCSFGASGAFEGRRWLLYHISLCTLIALYFGTTALATNIDNEASPLRFLLDLASRTGYNIAVTADVLCSLFNIHKSLRRDRLSM